MNCEEMLHQIMSDTQRVDESVGSTKKELKDVKQLLEKIVEFIGKPIPQYYGDNTRGKTNTGE